MAIDRPGTTANPDEGGGGTPAPTGTKYVPPTGVPPPPKTYSTVEALKGTPAYTQAKSWGLTDDEALAVACFILSDPTNGVQNGSNWVTNQPTWLTRNPGYKEGVQSGLWTNPGNYNAKMDSFFNLYVRHFPNASKTDSGFISLFTMAAQNGWNEGDFESHTIQVSGTGGTSAFDPINAPSFVKNQFSPSEWKTITDQSSGVIDTPEGRGLVNKASWYQTELGLYGTYNQPPPSRAQMDADWQRSGGDTSVITRPFQQAANAVENAAGQGAADAAAEARRIQRINTAAQHIVEGYDLSVRGLFTAQELQNDAIWDAGGEWGDASISKLIALAGPVNQLFVHYYGRGVSREELEQYYKSGATPEVINNELQSRGIQAAFTPDIKSLFSDAEIKSYSDQNAGFATPDGARIDALVRLAIPMNNLYKQYYGRGITRQELEAAYAQGLTPEVFSGQQQGAGYIQANKSDIQYYEGAFGAGEGQGEAGQFSADQLQQLGQNKVGLGTPQGQMLQAAFDKAIQRAQSAFQGVTAKISNQPLDRFGQKTLPDINA